MTTRTDHSEYLIVAIAEVGSEAQPSVVIESIRANSEETATKIADWLMERSGVEASVFFDPPKIGQ